MVRGRHRKTGGSRRQVCAAVIIIITANRAELFIHPGPASRHPTTSNGITPFYRQGKRGTVRMIICPGFQPGAPGVAAEPQASGPKSPPFPSTAAAKTCTSHMSRGHASCSIPSRTQTHGLGSEFYPCPFSAERACRGTPLPSHVPSYPYWPNGPARVRPQGIK